MRFLITGPAGAGKTYLSTALQSRGVNALDADTIPGLCGWFNKVHGHRVTYPPNADKTFLDEHAFLWRREALVQLLNQHESLYLCGIARNWFEMVPLFDKVYFLKATPELLAHRLAQPSRKNPMGRTAYQLEYVRYWARTNEERAISLGVELIDADQTPEAISAWVQAAEHRPARRDAAGRA